MTKFHNFKKRPRDIDIIVSMRSEPVSSELFSYSNGIMTAEMSELPASCIDRSNLLRIKSSKTGHIAIFKVAEIVRDHENEITSIQLKPYNPTAKTVKQVVIYND